MSMQYISVCSGIEAATCAWHPLGWEPFAFSEIEAFPSAVLAHHYPDVPNLGDMTKFKEWPDATIDLLVGGTPCQSFSVAGLRKGLDDPRGNLMLTYLAIADRYRPRWLVWENVPGVLSSAGGRDFGSLLGGLAELGYGFAYRVLDAQYFGVPQRRRRVFVVGCLGDWRRSAAVLFERHGLQGNPPPSRKAGQGSPQSTAPCIDASFGRLQGCSGQDANHGHGHLIAFAQNSRDEVRMFGGDGQTVGALSAEPGMKQTTYVAFHGSQDPDVSGDVTHPVGRNQGQETCVAIQAGALRENPESGPDGVGVSAEGVAYTLEARAEVQAAMTPSMQVRRLTPRECERLQGFPDDYTLIPVRGKPAADGPRYKALGNSMAVPVMAWIGRRIAEVDAIENREAA